MILDPTCGSKMFWFEKKKQGVVYGDMRRGKHVLCDGRVLSIAPDLQLDFMSLPFGNEIFEMVVFDPPHMVNVGEKSWTYLKYGRLKKNWKEQMTRGFGECFRVLDQRGVLIFKWNEIQIKVSEVLKLTDRTPLFGHRSGKNSNTHWICFMKGA